MAKKTKPPRTIPASPPRIHEATLGSQGKVVRGAEITDPQAVVRRQAGLNIVVCDGPRKMNRALAQRIENQVGPNKPGFPHVRTAGLYALPHFQQINPPPEGHSFYETEHRKAVKGP
jgi:hypothetical protein